MQTLKFGPSFEINIAQRENEKYLLDIICTDDDNGFEYVTYKFLSEEEIEQLFEYFIKHSYIPSEYFTRINQEAEKEV